MNIKTFITVMMIAAIGILALACGNSATTDSDMKTVVEKKVSDNLTVSILSPQENLKMGEQSLALKFSDGNGNPVEISAASLNFHMPAMGSMAAMNDPAQLGTTSTPGEFHGTVNLQMTGDWIAQISYEGKETGKTTMSVSAY